MFAVVHALESRVLLSATYTITDLGTLPGYDSSFAQGINSAGEVAGYVQDSNGGQQAFFWSGGGGMKGLGILSGYDNTLAGAINDSGEVAGTATSADGSHQGFTYTSGGGLNPLGFLAGGANSSADAINNAGEVAGSSDDSTGNTQAATWSSAGAIEGLGYLSGGATSAAVGVNVSGQVAGSSQGSNGQYQAFLDTPGSGLKEIGFPSGSSYTAADGVNDAGQIVLTSFNSDGSIESSYVWSSGGGFKSIGVLTGTTQTIAGGINGKGQVVGEAEDDAGDLSAFLWTSAAGIQNLNSLIDPTSGWMLRGATAINDNGQIVGSGINPQGQTDAFLLSPPGVQPPAMLTAMISAPPIDAATASAEAITVVYTDSSNAINTATISGSDLTVTAPGGGSLSATLASISGSGQSVTAIYNVAAPSGSWAVADDGTYAISIGAGAVTDANGVGVGAASGSFPVSIATTPGPFTASISAAPIAATTATPESITVIYTDASSAINTATIAGSNLTVTEPGGASLSATLGSISGSGQSVTAIYSVAAPNGSWSFTDDGQYAISISAGAVTDMSGIGVSAASGSFSVSILPPPPGPFTAAISDSNIVAASSAPEQVIVLYTDTQSVIDISTIAAGNLSVTNAQSMPLGVTLAGISGAGGMITATYNIAAPNGGWTNADNGTYSVNVITGSVTDQAGGGVSAASASFSVAIPQPPPPPLVNNSVLTPALIGKLPKTALVAGGSIAPIQQTLRIKNTGSTVMTGIVIVNLLLSTDPTGASNGTSAGVFHQLVRLKPGKTANIPLVLRALPAGPTGSLYLLPQVTDPVGNTAFTATAAPVTVEAPFIDLSGQFFHVPPSAKAGKSAVVLVTVVNNGNISAAGLLAVGLQLSDTSTSPATVTNLDTFTHRITIRPHKQTRLRLTIPLPATGGPFTVTAVLNSNNAFVESDTSSDVFTSGLITLK